MCCAVRLSQRNVISACNSLFRKRRETTTMTITDKKKKKQQQKTKKPKQTNKETNKQKHEKKCDKNNDNSFNIQSLTACPSRGVMSVLAATSTSTRVALGSGDACCRRCTGLAHLGH